MKFRMGASGRTLRVQIGDYPDDMDLPIGIVDTTDQANIIVDAVNAVVRIRQIHQPDPSPRSGWNADDGPSEYGTIERACRECGATDMAVPWPCPTIRAIDGSDDE